MNKTIQDLALEYHKKLMEAEANFKKAVAELNFGYTKEGKENLKEQFEWQAQQDKKMIYGRD